MLAEITHIPYEKYVSERIADTCLYQSVMYSHHASGITVLLLEASANLNPMELYISDNHDDYFDDMPVVQAFSAIRNWLQWEYPEYSKGNGYHALVLNPKAIFDGCAEYKTDYTVYRNGKDIMHDTTKDELLCKRNDLRVGDVVTTGRYKRISICTPEHYLLNRSCATQGYYRYRVVAGAKRDAFECDPERVARWSVAHNAWLWHGHTL